MTAPQWITLSNLGIYSETVDFNINSLHAYFSATPFSTVTRLNGELPEGLTWQQGQGNVVIIGESVGIDTEINSEITFRITQTNGLVADRTFNLRLTPIVNPPSWFGQSQFLGYASSGQLSTYRVHATTDTNVPITYAIAAYVPPSGLSINSQTGLISYSAPITAVDQTIAFTIRATTGAYYSDLPVTIGLLTIPHAPAWLTPSGLIAEVFEDEMVEVKLEAYDSSNTAITYSLVSSTPAFPFTLVSNSGLSNDALVYGNAPTVYGSTTYQFTIAATTAYGTTNRTFDIIANPAEIGTLLRWNSPTGQLSPVVCGQFHSIDVGATSDRSLVVNYSIVGGILPRTMMLLPTQGYLAGFVEYQTRTREYFFDVRADDGVQQIQRRYTLLVERGISYQFMDITVPLEGSLKDLYYGYRGAAINSVWVPDSNIIPQSLLNTPYFRLITGLNYAVDNPATAIGYANLHLHTSEVMIGSVNNINVSPTTTLFYAPIVDDTDGANPQLPQVANVIAHATDSITIAEGHITFTNVNPLSNVTSLVRGTQLRITSLTDPNAWMQGPIVSFLGSILTLDSQLTSGSGTRSSWEINLAPVYPPSFDGIRRDMIAGLGWVTDGQGSGSQLQATVDVATGSITSVLVIEQGAGFFYDPLLNVVGQGTGAVLRSNLTVNGYSVHDPGTNWQIGDQITLDIPTQRAAVLTVSAVNTAGGILAFSIDDGGDYDLFPVLPRLLTHANGAPASVLFSLGIESVSVISGGSGYKASSTRIDTAGHELLPSWQSRWMPYVSFGEVYSTYADEVGNRQTQALNDTLYYQRWPLQHAILSLQGICWTGDTLFDDTTTSFDGSTTYFSEWLEPRDTLFDADLEVFDQGNTRFDDDYALWQSVAYRAWGQTLFDEQFTIFDLYSTIFDDSPTTTSSLTLLRRLLRITTAQISGHNVVV